MKTLFAFILISLVACKKQAPADVAPVCPPDQVIGCACANGEGFHFGAAGYRDECKDKGGVIYWHCN